MRAARHILILLLSISIPGRIALSDEPKPKPEVKAEAQPEKNQPPKEQTPDPKKDSPSKEAKAADEKAKTAEESRLRELLQFELGLLGYMRNQMAKVDPKKTVRIELPADLAKELPEKTETKEGPRVLSLEQIRELLGKKLAPEKAHELLAVLQAARHQIKKEGQPTDELLKGMKPEEANKIYRGLVEEQAQGFLDDKISRDTKVRLPEALVKKITGEPGTELSVGEILKRLKEPKPKDGNTSGAGVGNLDTREWRGLTGALRADALRIRGDGMRAAGDLEKLSVRGFLRAWKRKHRERLAEEARDQRIPSPPEPPARGPNIRPMPSAPRYLPNQPMPPSPITRRNPNLVGPPAPRNIRMSPPGPITLEPGGVPGSRGTQVANPHQGGTGGITVGPMPDVSGFFGRLPRRALAPRIFDFNDPEVRALPPRPDQSYSGGDPHTVWFDHEKDLGEPEDLAEDGPNGKNSAAFALQEKGNHSLQLKTAYGDDPTNQSLCQITLVHEQKAGAEDFGGQKVDMCWYVGMTARHCVTDEKHDPTARCQQPEPEIPNEHKLSRVGVQGLHITEFQEPAFAPDCQDAALLRFKSNCNSQLPIVPIAKVGPNEGDTLVAQTPIPLVCRTVDNVINRDLITGDCRDSRNGGLDIEHGNSGGGVVKMVCDGSERTPQGTYECKRWSPELVGVISARAEDGYGNSTHPGVGLFASKNALTWAKCIFYPELRECGGDKSIAEQTHPRTPATHAGH